MPRQIRQIAAVQSDTHGDTVYALDDLGVLWRCIDPWSHDAEWRALPPLPKRQITPSDEMRGEMRGAP